MADKKLKLYDILEISSMWVDGDGTRFVDSNLLMYLAQFNSYSNKEDIIEDGGSPRRIKLQMHIYVEELEE